MAKYSISELDMRRGLAIQRNLKNNRKRVFTMETRKDKPYYKKWSSEYETVSHIGPKQERDTHVLFVASEGNNLYLLLNNKEVIKVRKWLDKTSNGRLFRGLEDVRKGTYQIEKGPKSVEIYSQHDETYLIRHKSFGEFLYSNKYDRLSPTFDYITNQDFKGFRLVVLDKNNTKGNNLAYLSQDNFITDEAFHGFVNDKFIKELTPTLELVEQVNGNNKVYYFLDANRRRCSKKYVAINALSDRLVASMETGNQVLLNDLGEEVTPHFVSFKPLNNHYALQIDKHNNQCVIYNPNATTKNLSAKLGKTTLCEEYNLVLGDIEVGKDKKRCVVINADYPTKAYEVDPCIGLLMMSYLNGVRLNSHLINKVINNKAVIDSSLNAFNDCINQSVPKDEQTPITNRYNVCAKFLTRLKKSANYRIKRYEHQTEMLNQEVRDMDMEYSGYIADYEAQIAELEALKKQKEEEYKYNRVRKEEEIKLRGEEIDDEKGIIGKKETSAKKYKTYIDNLKAKNPNATEELLEEEPENE